MAKEGIQGGLVLPSLLVKLIKVWGEVMEGFSIPYVKLVESVTAIP